MRAQDVTDTIELALTASGCDQAVVRHKPRLLSDNGSCYISGDLAEWLEGQKMKHVRGAPFHPQTQGKIERWHQTMKNRVLLENYYLPPLTHAAHVLPGNGRSRTPDRGFCGVLQQPALPFDRQVMLASPRGARA